MDPKDIRGPSLGAMWNFLEGQGSHDSGLGRVHKGPVRPTCIGTIGARPVLILFCSKHALIQKKSDTTLKPVTGHVTFFSNHIVTIPLGRTVTLTPPHR
jgi:hypothetical protein